MKKIKTSFVATMVLTLATLTLQAIPNQIGGVGGFVNVLGMRFENFAEEAKTWKPNAKLPGKWEDWKDPGIKDSSIMVYRLNMTADVFGIRASEVTAQLKDDQVIKFNIVFNKSSFKSASLIDQLTTNIRSFTGESGDAKKKSFAHKNLNIQLKDGSNGEVIVTISSKSAAVAVR